MPIAMRRWCGSGAPPGSEICRRAMVGLLSQRFEAPVDVVRKALAEHEGSDLPGRGGEVAPFVERRLQLRERGAAMRRYLVGERLDLVDAARSVQRFAPLHLLHQE